MCVHACVCVSAHGYASACVHACMQRSEDSLCYHSSGPVYLVSSRQGPLLVLILDEQVSVAGP